MCLVCNKSPNWMQKKRKINRCLHLFSSKSKSRQHNRTILFYGQHRPPIFFFMIDTFLVEENYSNLCVKQLITHFPFISLPTRSIGCAEAKCPSKCTHVPLSMPMLLLLLLLMRCIKWNRKSSAHIISIGKTMNGKIRKFFWNNNLFLNPIW